MCGGASNIISVPTCSPFSSLAHAFIIHTPTAKLITSAATRSSESSQKRGEVVTTAQRTRKGGGRYLFIGDPATVEAKKKALVRGGASQLQVIADFDRTLTKINSLSSWSVIERKAGFSEAYHEESQRIYKHYRAIEIDPNLTIEQKTPKMIEWWKRANELLVIEGTTRQRFINAVRDNMDEIELRDGYEIMFALLKKQAIPLMILSAGVGDMIQYILKYANVGLADHPNTHVLSNFLEFEEKTGLCTGFSNKETCIHIFNKNEAPIKKTAYHAEVEERKNVIVLGDSLGDLQMSKGVEHDTVLTIGFYNHPVEGDGQDDEHLAQYIEAYDVVLVMDDTLEYALGLIQDILPKD